MALRHPPLGLGLVVGALVGFLAGLTGVGGGIFLGPLLMLMGWADARQTCGVSAAFILVNSLAGLTAHTATIGELPPILLPWAGAAVVGGLVGSGLGSRRFSRPTLRRLLACVLAVAALKLAFLM